MRKNKMSVIASRIFAAAMSAVLAFSAAVPVSAKTDNNKNKNEDDKSETVYVNADASGEATDITVSDWLQNKLKGSTIEDESSLSDIKNVKGDEDYTKNADGSITWNADGNDIYYQGTTSEELPVTMRVTYYLDGKKIDPDDLAGKSGKVKMRFDYTNNTASTQKVDGKEISVQTPFTMITAMSLDGEVFSDVEVENGRVISDGDKNIVVGMAFPGLKESLKLDSYEKLSDVDIPDYFEVTAEVTDFELAMTATVATTGSLDEIDTSALDDADGLKDDIDKLTDGMDELLDGCDALVDGMEELDDGAKEYVKGVKTASDGSEQLADGLKTLNKEKIKLADGAKQLQDGISDMKDGTSTLKSGIKAYTDGTVTLADGISSAKTGADTLTSGSATLKSGLTEYTAGVKKVSDGVDQLSKALDAAYKKAGINTKDAESLKELQETVDKISGYAKNLKNQETKLKALVSLVKSNQSAINEYDKTVQSATETLKKESQSAIDKVILDAQSKSKELSTTVSISDEQLGKINESITVDSSNVNITGSSDVTEKINKAKSQLNFDTSGMTQDQIDAVNAAKKTLEEASDNVSKQSVSKDNLKGSVTKDTIQKNVSVSVDELKLNASDYSIDNEFEKQKNTLSNKKNEIINTIDITNSDIAELNAILEELTPMLKRLSSYTDNTKNLTAALKNLKDNVDALNSGADTLVSKNESLNNGMASLNSGVKSLDSGLATLQSGALKLTGSNAALNSGATSLDEGAAKLKKGSSALTTGINAFNDGVKSAAVGAGDLESGMNKLVSAGGTLTAGTSKLLSGGGELSDGVNQLNDEGISKIVDLAGEDLQTVIRHFKAVKEADQEYESFTGIKKGQSGNVKFIIETAEISTDED